MTRKILCRPCGAKWKMHPDDRHEGWKFRMIPVASTPPKDHGITVNGVFSPMSELVCDDCAKKIGPGEIVQALTMWNANREGNPGPWENDYGTVLPQNAADLAVTLEKP